MPKCPVCGSEEMFHTCSQPDSAQALSGAGKGKSRRGFLASIRLAFDIVTGSVRLLWRYPILITPLVPLFLLLIAFEIALIFLPNIVMWVLLFGVAYCLMFSFAITSNMLKQINDRQSPEFWKSFGASATGRMIANVFGLSAVWFTLVILLVAIETAIKTLLDRGGERVAAYVDSFFDTFASALRMMGFMMIPIMVFEGAGLGDAYKRLKTILRESPISALSGLALTKVASLVILLIIMGFGAITDSLSETTNGLIVLFGLPLIGFGWMLAMFLEQIFASGLYLYTTSPESEVVKILLEKQIGRDLPVPQLGQAAQVPMQ